MKQLLIFLTAFAICIGLVGCAPAQEDVQIVATTLPVYEFTVRICEGTDITVTRLITESVSCLHDYTLQTAQMRSLEKAQVVVTSGAGLEDFLDDIIDQSKSIDASNGVPLICNDMAHGEQGDHDHSEDPHIWLSPENATIMATNIASGLTKAFPQYKNIFSQNLSLLTDDLEALSTYGKTQLADLSYRDLITFHDGFSYMADAFDLNIVHAIEEESGREASAAELIDLIQIVTDHNIKAIYTEQNGSDAAAKIIAAETGAKIYQLDMAMSGESYFDTMYRNIDTLKEALK